MSPRVYSHIQSGQKDVEEKHRGSESYLSCLNVCGWTSIEGYYSAILLTQNAILLTQNAIFLYGNFENILFMLQSLKLCHACICHK